MRPNSGVSSYMTAQGVSAVFGANPTLDVCSPMWKWYLHETSKGVFSASFENALAADIDYCHAHDKGIIARATAGTDAPIGRPGTTQASWLIPRGVGRIRTWDNDPTPTLYNKEIYVPDLVSASSATQYIDDLVDWFARLATLLSANDVGGHPRWHHIAFLTIPGPEDGTEMPLGYGSLGDTVYANCGTLASAITAGQMSFTLTSPSGATGECIYLIGSEVLHVLSRSGGVVTVGRRGHSGTAAAAHSAGAQVMVGTSRVTTGTYNGYTAPYDHRRLNAGQWATLGSESACRTKIAGYWQDACLAIAAALPAELAVSIAAGSIFDDGLAAADAILEVVGPALGARFVGGTTNLVDDYGDPSAPNSSPATHDWLLRCLELGCQTFVQTAGVTRLLEPPAPGALNRLVRTGVQAVANYRPLVFETGRRRFENRTTQATSAYGAWPGGVVDQRGFLVG